MSHFAAFVPLEAGDLQVCSSNGKFAFASCGISTQSELLLVSATAHLSPLAIERVSIEVNQLDILQEGGSIFCCKSEISSGKISKIYEIAGYSTRDFL
jgi:hypothetical protein